MAAFAKRREPALYDEKSLEDWARFQRDEAWDLERSIDWATPIDLNKPLTALDKDAILFPGAASEQRLAISQMMGLVIAASICEMEECLIRLRGSAWRDVISRYPVSPEFKDLGELFFEEETKHSQAFRRYIEKFANTAGLSLDDLLQILPTVEGTWTENRFRRNLERGGQAFWWSVALVEQEFLLLYTTLAPHKARIEPLYFDLHRKHFEEEARHAPFPFLLLEMMIGRGWGPRHQFHSKSDLALAQVLQMTWSLKALDKLRLVKKLVGVHPLFEALATALPLLEKQPPGKIIWTLVTRAPYVSGLVNPNCHRQVLRFAKKLGVPQMPFFSYEPAPTVRY